MRKVVIFSAPSGSGKSTIVSHLLGLGLGLEFSISATSRAPRGQERDGREYYFFTAEEFREALEAVKQNGGAGREREKSQKPQDGPVRDEASGENSGGNGK